jgi:hypothetical protein
MDVLHVLTPKQWLLCVLGLVALWAWFELFEVEEE